MKVNDKVNGSYCNHEFSGTILQSRVLTVPTDGAFEFLVALNETVEIYGTIRDRLLVVTKYDGSPSSYTGYSEWMRLTQ